MSENATPTRTELLAEARELLRAKALRDLHFYVQRMRVREQDPSLRLQGGAVDESRDRQTLRELLRDLHLASEER
jgi:hypothetical protein